MNRKKLVILIIAVSLFLSGCNLSTGGNIPGYTTYDSSDSQTVTQENTDDAPSVTPENTEDITSDTADTENTEETTSDTDESDTPDESGEASESEEDTTTSTKSEPSSSPSVTTTTAATTTTTKATTTTTTQPINAEPSPPTIYATTADGTLTSSTSLAVIDYSNSSDGYVMAKYTGSSSKVMVRITYPDGAAYSYNLNTKGSYEVFPLTGGNGKYSILVGESAGGDKYAVAATCDINVSLSNSLAPYLRPSQYVNFSKGDAAVTMASKLCAGTATVLEKVDRIYSWVVENVNYDKALASDVNNKKVTSYLANPTKIINEKKGICYDYAVGMAAMLRSQGIPTQVVFGDVTSVGYHAWINVYTNETGWICGAIYFDGKSWCRMDATLAASNRGNNKIYDFINNNSNYYSIKKLY